MLASDAASATTDAGPATVGQAGPLTIAFVNRSRRRQRETRLNEEELQTAKKKVVKLTLKEQHKERARKTMAKS